MTVRENPLAEHRRIVVKVGSALLVNEAGQFDPATVTRIADEIAVLRRDGREVLVVSSGAVAIGLGILGIERRRARLEELQASAAAGQVQLVEAWRQALATQEIAVAQILLVPDDTEDRRRFLNARGTLLRLLELGVTPIINENDTVATEELRYGDNDRLAARVAQMVMADALVLLSDVDGLYTADPRRDTSATHIAHVERLTGDIFAIAGASGSTVGSGGMRTKMEAARIATRAGCTTLVASGRSNAPLTGLGPGKRYTEVAPRTTPAAARKQWLAGALGVRGALHVDAGAEAALGAGKSLLPVGITAVEGSFDRGDTVALIGAGGAEFARGIAAYEADEVLSILGCRSDDIEDRLGYRGRSVVVHCDDLVILNH